MIRNSMIRISLMMIYLTFSSNATFAADGPVLLQYFDQEKTSANVFIGESAAQELFGLLILGVPQDLLPNGVSLPGANINCAKTWTMDMTTTFFCSYHQGNKGLTAAVTPVFDPAATAVSGTAQTTLLSEYGLSLIHIYGEASEKLFELLEAKADRNGIKEAGNMTCSWPKGRSCSCSFLTSERGVAGPTSLLD